MKSAITVDRCPCDLATIVVYVTGTPSSGCPRSAYPTLPDHAVMVHEAPYNLVLIPAFATESGIVGLPIRGFFTKFVPI